MFGIGSSKPPSGLCFVIGKSSLFRKNLLTPSEFGSEITRLGFGFGLEQFDQYQKARDISTADMRLLKEVARNPGIIQILYANLVTGAFLCYAKVVLRAPNDAVAAVEEGVLTELRSTMPGMSEKVLKDHTDITANFAIAIEREVRQIEENCSLNLLFRYINDFYPGLNAGADSPIPTGLSSFITGLGSRFMAVCQDDFQLTLQRR